MDLGIGRRTPLPLRPELPWLVALYAFALALRWPLLGMPSYGDEGMLYYIARHLWQAPGNIEDVYTTYWYYPRWVFWQRPAFFVLLAPAAQISFEAYRVFHLLLASLLPVAGVLLLREAGIRRPAAYGGGLGVAALPILVTWGVVGLMDSLGTVAFLFAAWALERGRLLPAFLFALAAAWTKEIMLLGVGVLLLLELLRDRPTIWPLRLNERQTALLAVLPLGVLPVVYAMSLGLGLPGGRAGSDYLLRLPDQLLVSTWFVPLLVLGLRWTRTRALAAVALAYATSYVLLHAVAGRAVEFWYLVPTQAFAVLTVAATLDEAMRRRTSRRTRNAGASAAVVAALLLALVVLAPATPARNRIVHPLSGEAELSLLEANQFDLHRRDQDRERAEASVAVRSGGRYFVVDAEAPYYLHPFADRAALVVTGYTDVLEVLPLAAEPWAEAVENRTESTLIRKRPQAMNEALRTVYADCVSFDEGNWVVIRGGDCRGRASELDAVFQERRAAA